MGLLLDGKITTKKQQVHLRSVINNCFNIDFIVVLKATQCPKAVFVAQEYQGNDSKQICSTGCSSQKRSAKAVKVKETGRSSGTGWAVVVRNQSWGTVCAVAYQRDSEI